MAQASARAAARFYELMKRVRSLGDHPGPGPLTSPAQMALLDAIRSTPGRGVNELAASLRLTPPTVSVGVRRLEQAGLLERRPNPQDRRAVCFDLTRRGRALQQRIQQAHLRRFVRLLQGLRPRERQTLLDLLERAVAAAESTPPTDDDPAPTAAAPVRRRRGKGT